MHQHGFVFYGLKTHHMAMHWLLVFLFAVDMPCSIQVAFGYFVSTRHWRASLFISLGTLVLLLHGAFGVKFVQHMISFH
ncbi:hypothetical protein MtrunA17_Chr4g0007241 [Medicago truncatula]|uniref:Transmembrane protein n=1 Tax=Medicago truncatula TaxID=3880 RepID=A0A396I7R9_MEDTR|nr:hypothetical protein MtrunA17_Chr4g0007241 [Medicago truncatula]